MIAELLIAAACRFAPVKQISGVVMAHKHSSPYPFTAECSLLQSKVTIGWIETEPDGEQYTEKYRSYVTPSSVCVGLSGRFPCAELQPGDAVTCQVKSHLKSPGRGQIVSCEVAR